MGAAISMLADPEWEHILLESVAKGGFLGEGAAAKVRDILQQRADPSIGESS